MFIFGVYLKRISKNSSIRAIFNSAAPRYQKALSDSGYNHKLEYDPNENVKNANTKQKRRRKQKTTWFNPPIHSMQNTIWDLASRN